MSTLTEEKRPLNLPKDGLAGFKESIGSDALSGFLVFLLAMPLSLGIAKASDFPPIYGIITAIIGGLVVSLLSGSKLTIKGPAAGLIVICSGAVAEFGGGSQGWQLALGAIVVAGLFQIGMGLLKMGKYSDFVPSSAIHGMLAAIGIIIFSKQIHVLLGIDPKQLKGLEPLELLAHIPQSIAHADWKPTLIGLVSLGLLFGLPLIKHPFIKRLPIPLLVLLFAIPMGLQMDFKHTEPAFDLVNIGNLADALKINAQFDGISMTGVFVKYVLLFALIGSIESLLTVKAIDKLDPWNRKSDYSRDLVAVGIGNVVSGLLGGLPMISEVARSSANVNNGARTRWANFFHGFWMLLFVLTARPVIEMIPNAALAAMLIMVGFRLAHPKEFIHMLHIGKPQFFVFVATIVVTLATDLLIGVFTGIALKLVINAFLGKVSLNNIFKVHAEVKHDAEHHYTVALHDSVTFSNYLSIKEKLEEIPAGKEITLDLSDVQLADHTVMENLYAIVRDYQNAGGKFEIVGLENSKSLGTESSSGRIRTRIHA
jgi:MFS superfamily sulfate permease-like transporter